jgi:O-acetyl-ADP-ribose deacetylase (regulator of RNase III)
VTAKSARERKTPARKPIPALKTSLVKPDIEMHSRAEESQIISRRVGDRGEIRVEMGDICRLPYDAIVNAANSELLPGGGVCGAIHRAGGPAIAEECRRIRADRGPLSPAETVVTTAGHLPARYVIHTLGPIWRGGNHREADALSSCYRVSIRVADELKLRSIGFPAISTGIFGYPAEEAAGVAIPAAIEQLKSSKWGVFIAMVMFDKATSEAFADALAAYPAD